MPARLLLVNPSKRRRKKKASAAQLRARAKFAAAARARAKKAKRKTAAKKKATVSRKKPARKSAAKKRSSTTRRKTVARKRKSTARRKVRRKARKNPSSAKRKAAARKAARTRAANKRKRSAAAKKAARTRKRKSPARRRARRNPGTKAGARKARKRRSTKLARKTGRRLSAARRAAKRSKPRSARRRVHRARVGALAVKRAAQAGKLPSGAKKLARQHGLLRVNPNLSLKSALKDAWSLMPQAAAGLGAFAGAHWVGQKIDQHVMQRFLPASVSKWGLPAATASATALGYWAVRMNKATSKFAMPVLLGGMIASLWQLLNRVDMGGASVASKMGLPGLGEYVAMGSAPHPYLMADGADIRLNGMGEYVADPGVGEYVAMGAAGEGVFSGSSIGSFDQMGYGREGHRGYSSIPTAEEILSGDAEGGVLSGSIFDD